MLEDILKYKDSPFLENISELVIYQKNEILKKTISYFLSKKYQDAQDYFVATYPEFSQSEDPNALLIMGHIQLKIHQLDSAIEYFRQSLKKTEINNFFINDSLALIHFYKRGHSSLILCEMKQRCSTCRPKNIDISTIPGKSFCSQNNSEFFHKACFKLRLQFYITFLNISLLG